MSNYASKGYGTYKCCNQLAQICMKNLLNCNCVTVLFKYSINASKIEVMSSSSVIHKKLFSHCKMIIDPGCPKQSR